VKDPVRLYYFPVRTSTDHNKKAPRGWERLFYSLKGITLLTEITVTQSPRKCRLCDAPPLPGRQCCARCEPVFRERLARKRSMKATANLRGISGDRPAWLFPRRRS
jgi:hypothetical protein